MNDEARPKFRTKTGFCTITPDQIVLTRGGLRGQIAEVMYGSGSRLSTLIRSAVIGFSLLGFGFYLLTRHATFGGVFLVAFGAYFLLNVVLSCNSSATPVIPRTQIQTIVACKPMPPTTRGYFTIAFLENSRQVQRLIILPGVLDGGEAEFQKALMVFQSCGLRIS